MDMNLESDIANELRSLVDQARREEREKREKLIEDLIYDLADEGDNWDYQRTVAKYKKKYLAP